MLFLFGYLGFESSFVTRLVSLLLSLPASLVVLTCKDVLGERNFCRDLEQSVTHKIEENNTESRLRAPIAQLALQPRTATITFSDGTNKNESDKSRAVGYLQHPEEDTGLPYTQHNTEAKDAALQKPGRSTDDKGIRMFLLIVR